MMIEQTMEKLRALRLRGMAEAYQQQLENPDVARSPSTNGWACWWTNTAPGVRTRPWRGG